MKTSRKHHFARFLDLTWADINCDLHVHTVRTDGKADVKSVLDYAASRGLSRIAFTEHVRKDTTWFPEFADEIRVERAAYPQLEAWIGCEAKALDTRGSLDVTDEIMAECDIVLGSVHRFPDGQGGYIDFSSLAQKDVALIELELALGLLDSAPIDVLAHPGSMYFRRYGDYPDDMMRQILNKSLEQGVAVEINTTSLGDVAGYLRLCAEVNPYVSIGSDAHRLEQLGKARDILRSHEIGGDSK